MMMAHFMSVIAIVFTASFSYAAIPCGSKGVWDEGSVNVTLESYSAKRDPSGQILGTESAPPGYVSIGIVAFTPRHGNTFLSELLPVKGLTTALANGISLSRIRQHGDKDLSQRADLKIREGRAEVRFMGRVEVFDCY